MILTRAYKENQNMLLLRFFRALGLAAFALATLVVTVALLWRSAQITILENWFGRFNDDDLTIMSGVMIIALYLGVSITQKSEQRCRERLPEQ